VALILLIVLQSAWLLLVALVCLSVPAAAYGEEGGAYGEEGGRWAYKATVPDKPHHTNRTSLTRGRLILALLVLLALPVVSPHSPLDIAARL